MNAPSAAAVMDLRRGQPAAPAVVVFEHRLSDAIVASLDDRDRICPAFCGTGLVEGGVLRLRVPTGELRVDAPNRLLKRVFEVCDGQRTFSEILSREPEGRREELAGFMEFLFEQGALVDAVHLTIKAAALGFQTTPVGKSAPAHATGTMATRFARSHGPVDPQWTAAAQTPLSPLVRARASCYTFDDTQAVSDEQLAGLVWAAGGIVSESHPRLDQVLPQRTTPSAGGLYLLRWFVLLLRPTDGRAPGVYEATFPAAGMVAWRLVSPDTATVLRAFLKPWQLIHATGAVVAVGDAHTAALRYRNRALQYLQTEAGAALQNLSLAAPALGLAGALIGGYSDEHVKALCRLGDECVLGTAIFGPRPTPAQVAAVDDEMPIDFVWSDAQTDIYPLRTFAARARVAGRDSTDYDTFGKDTDPYLAYVKAHAETVERQGAREVANVSVGRLGDLDGQIAPDRIARFAPSQHADPRFPYAPFDPALTYHWVAGTDLDSGRRVHVPGDFVYGHAAMGAHAVTSRAWIQANSSGCAAGPSLDFALQAGLLEVIERDAFMRHWFAQTPGRRIAAGHFSAGAAQRVQDMHAAGCRVTLQKLDSAAAHVVLASATNDARHFTSVTAAARFDLADAVDAALDELEIAVYTRLVGQTFAPLKAADVRDPAGHALLYAQKSHYRRADRVLSPAQELDAASARPSAERDLDGLVARLRSQGLDPCYVDITPARHCINQGRTPLHAVKAVVAGLIPISFGFEREPRAMADKLHRGAFVPHPFP